MTKIGRKKGRAKNDKNYQDEILLTDFASYARRYFASQKQKIAPPLMSAFLEA